MAFTCDSCGTARSGAPITSITGRKLCQACSDRLTGAAAGYVATGTVSGAVATGGFFERLRARRRRSGT